MRMHVAAVAALALCVATTAARAADPDKQTKKLVTAREVYQELVTVPEHEVPKALLDDCKCVAVIPNVIKGAFGFGFRAGSGVMTCRNERGWSPPTFISLRSGSWGFQIGAQGIDVVLFFMTERGARSMIESRFTLGASAGVAAGPVGRSAEAGTDVKFNAEIYSYAKSKGLFAGVSIEGSHLAPDRDANAAFYGAAVDPAALLFEHKAPRTTPELGAFLEVLP
jgi:lipid-binding SYLF domain-containing protein